MIICLLTGCVGVPKGVKPVQGFESDRYLGRWFEIARLDHSFERVWVAKTSSAHKSLICSSLRPSCYPCFSCFGQVQRRVSNNSPGTGGGPLKLALFSDIHGHLRLMLHLIRNWQLAHAMEAFARQYGFEFRCHALKHANRKESVSYYTS